MIAKDDIYPAPSFAEAMPPSETALRQIIGRGESEAAAWFALGNLFLRDTRLAEAIEALEKAVQLGTPSCELLTNLGVALKEIGRLEDSLPQFRQAVLLGPEQFLPQFHLGLALSACGDLLSARSAFERAIRLNPQHTRAKYELARVVEKLEGLPVALPLFQEVLVLEPQRREVREQLARHEFDIGDQLFREGKLDEAFRTWWEAHERYAPAFVTSQELSAALQERIQAFRKVFRPRIQLRAFRQVCGDTQRTMAFAYPMFSRYLFSLGLFPEFYEAQESLDRSIERWKKSLADEGDHPFPHYRLALIHCYKGEMEQALVELRICQDRLLPKKQASLRVAKILSFVSDLVEVERRAAHLSTVAAGSSEWEAAGFGDPFQSEAWRKTGLKPIEAAAWRDAGLSPKQAVSWTKLQVTASQAAAWVQAGYASAKSAREWVRGGFPAERAKDWEQAFPGEAGSAVQWFKAGFTHPADAAKWAALVLFPWDAMRWIENGFTLEDTESFYERGIKDTYQALRERQKSTSE